jgi:glycyl-tRNA synthetase
MAKQEDVFKKVISHAKEYGFIFPSSEIYDGLSAIYDYGQNGAELKNNIKQYWWKAMVQLNENIGESIQQSLCTLQSGKLPDTWTLSMIR